MRLFVVCRQCAHARARYGSCWELLQRRLWPPRAARLGADKPPRILKAGRRMGPPPFAFDAIGVSTLKLAVSTALPMSGSGVIGSVGSRPAPFREADSNRQF